MTDSGGLLLPTCTSYGVTPVLMQTACSLQCDNTATLVHVTIVLMQMTSGESETHYLGSLQRAITHTLT
eukprot:2794-Heterococcus_DN1.PRE.1